MKVFPHKLRSDVQEVIEKSILAISSADGWTCVITTRSGNQFSPPVCGFGLVHTFWFHQTTLDRLNRFEWRERHRFAVKEMKEVELLIMSTSAGGVVFSVRQFDQYFPDATCEIFPPETLERAPGELASTEGVKQ
jgi:hypothetical protein